MLKVSEFVLPLKYKVMKELRRRKYHHQCTIEEKEYVINQRSSFKEKIQAKKIGQTG